ncbi:hypothetical protein PRNP1_007543 [Phytophthora ramorum]
MTDVNGSDKDAVSTLVLLGDKEYVLRASPGRVVFNNYSRDEASLEQAITLTLEGREDHSDRTSSTENAAVPIILSTPSTPRFALQQVSSHDAALSSSTLECLLSPSSLRTYIVKFRAPEVSESDFVWDNFHDQLVIHTRLSKLVIHLEAWKYDVPAALARNHENTLLFPASLPDVKAPPLKRFGAIERNGDQCQSPTKHTEPTKSASTMLLEDSNSLDASPKPRSRRTPRTPRSETLRPLTQSLAESSSVNVVQLPLPVVTAVQSQREAREVILKLRRRRTARSSNKVGASPTSVTDREVFPETVALDTNTKAELENFNNLVAAASDHVTKEAAKAKSELAYYQQLQLPTPPRDTAALKPRTPRQTSAVPKRPSKLPSLVRPSSGEATTTVRSTPPSNQEVSPLDQEPVRRKVPARQRIVKPTKLQALLRPTKPRKPQSSTNNQQQHDTESELSDFDDPDPGVDDAPVIPDDLSGVATLDADDPYL